MFLCITKTYAHMYYYCGMENLLQITHHEMQLIIGLAGVIGFFTFAGLVYFVDQVTTKKK